MKKKMFVLFTAAYFLSFFQSCSKSNDDIFFGNKWSLTSKMINGVETIQDCEKDNTYAFCYCGKLTIEYKGAPCAINEDVSAVTPITLSNNNKTISAYLSDEINTYNITLQDDKHLILESNASSSKQVLHFITN